MDEERRAAPEPTTDAPPPDDLRAVNERLLLAGLREQELADQLRRQLALHRRFLGITTHELKAPLAILKGYADLLRRRAQRGGDERLLGPLAAIDQQVVRMARLIDDLGDVARIESDGLALDARPLELLALLAGTIADVGLAAPDFALRLDARAGPVWVRGDGARLAQVLTNLLTNAVKYSAERREADIALRREGDRAVVAVTDHGIGIPATERDAVFEPYVRATNALTGGHGGLGLGLFISREIARRHGGTLTLVPAEGRGSTFSLSLPLLAAEGGAGA